MVERNTLALLVALLVFSLGGQARAVKVAEHDDMYLDLHFLLQFQAQFTYRPTVDPKAARDFFIRRSRVILMGKVHRNISFFMETDQPNWGKGGNWSDVPFIVQDAFVSFDLADCFSLQAGLMLPPFIHHAMQGAINLHTLDYHSALIKYPGGTQIVSRDAGLQARGLLWDQRIDYRAAITSGGGGGTDTAPRFAARVAYNLFDAEPGAFLGGTYLGDKRILSVGAAFIGQPDGVASDVNQPDRFDRPFLAAGGDVILDWPLDEDRVSGQLGLVWYGGASNPDRGLGLLFDLGYAIKWIEPLVALDWYRPQGADSFNGHLLGLHVGLNVWLVKHNATIKLDGGVIKASGDAMDDAATQITLQVQLFI